MRAAFSSGIIFAIVLACTPPAPATETTTLDLTTRELTDSDVAMSPDGKWLVATLLGHLHRLPVEGGRAQQMTFGPFYDCNPVYSPDGKRVAFVSDRDGSNGNIFVLELASGQISQLTQEASAERPSWSPDGQSIVYLRPERRGTRWNMASVHRVAVRGGESEVLSTPLRRITSVFHLPDGRVGWTLIEESAPGPWGTKSRIEVLDREGGASTFHLIQGLVRAVLASPSGEGLFCHRTIPRPGFAASPSELVFVPLPEGNERFIFPLSSGSGAAFAVGPDGKDLFLNHAGRLWKIDAVTGSREPLPFEARARLDVRMPVPPPERPIATEPNATVSQVLNPRMHPKGEFLIFEAAGFLWKQALEGGKAERLFEGSAYEGSAAFASDGSQLAFLRQYQGVKEVVVYDLGSRELRVLASGNDYGNPSWSPDGKGLLLTEYAGMVGTVVMINVEDHEKKELFPVGFWTPRPHFGSDGKTVYFSADTEGTGGLYKLPLGEEAEPIPLTKLTRHLSNGLVSPDGEWLAFQRNREIWIARMDNQPIENARRLSREGGDSFDFTPDSSALIYSSGTRVLRHKLTEEQPEEISLRFELSPDGPEPLLLRGVRVLDLDKGFGVETSLFVDGAKIQWIGDAEGKPLPPATRIIDATGKFLIPGLFDFHVHADGAYPEAFVAYGVTSVRDVGGSLARLTALNDRGVAFGAPVPRYFVSGKILEGKRPIWGDGFLQIHDEEEARTNVRRLSDEGAYFIKVYPSLSWPLQRVVTEEAHRLGLPVVGHGTSIDEIIKSVILGYHSLEHTTYPDRIYDDVLQMLAKSGTRWSPTVAVDGGDALLLRDEPERLLDKKFVAFTPEPYIHEARTSSYLRNAGDHVLHGAAALQDAALREAHHQGVRLHVGTDAPNPECFFGSSLHWEMEFFVRAGLPPLTVLRLATREAAVAVGAENLGSLAPGQIADMVLLDADPLQDIGNTQSVWRVIKGGRLFDPNELQMAAPAKADDAIHAQR